jgi:signal recognition particle subunit SRP54
MGDVLSLVEEATHKMDKKAADKLASKLKKGKGFDLEDFRDQLRQMNNMGGISSMLEKMPGMANIPAAAKSQVNDKELGKLEAIINSMTAKERQRPDIIKGSRKKRIAAGSGTQIQDVNRLLKQFTQMQKMMKKMTSKGGLAKMIRGMGMGGKLPPMGGGGLPF